jgi:hypothetical protein
MNLVAVLVLLLIAAIGPAVAEERLKDASGCELPPPSLSGKEYWAAENAYHDCIRAALDRMQTELQRSEAARNAAAKKARAECDRRGGASIGMTAQQVLASCWGKPEHRNVTIFAQGRSEQWVYPGGYLYFRDGRLEAIDKPEH